MVTLNDMCRLGEYNHVAGDRYVIFSKKKLEKCATIIRNAQKYYILIKNNRYYIGDSDSNPDCLLGDYAPASWTHQRIEFGFDNCNVVNTGNDYTAKLKFRRNSFEWGVNYAGILDLFFTYF